MEKRNPNDKAIEFLNSERGQYIMAQALSTAIKTMKIVPPPYTEHSNIADMEYIFEQFFSKFRAVV